MTAPVGRCLTMCPSSEFQIRSKEKLLHRLETCADDAVKRYSRSAAGLDLTREELLRPYPVLRRTVDHLLSTAILERPVPFHVVHGFVADRLRCVAQDAAVQRLSAKRSVSLYESMVKYHVYSARRLCAEDPEAFDPMWHQKATAEYLNRLLVCYDTLDGDPEPDEALDDYASIRPLMESINLIFNIGRTEPLLRYLKLTEDFRTPMLVKSFQISLCYIMKNYARIFQLLPKLPKLVSCALELHLPAVRRMALEVMSAGFNSKNLTYPMDKLKTLLCYETDADTVEDLKYYSILVTDEGVHFKKQNEDKNLKTKKPKFKTHPDPQVLFAKN